MSNCMIRGAPSTVSPHAIRPICSSKILRPRSISYAMCRSGDRHLCTDAKKKLLDDKILKALKCEIKSEEQFQIKHVLPVPPPDFPFTIEDNDWDDKITLRRDFNGEKIELVLEHFYDHEEANDGVVSDDGTYPSFVEVDVEISKQSGRKITIQVSAATDGVSANEISVAEESGAELLGQYDVGFVEDEDEFAIAMTEYLEIRGLENSCVRFLCKYLSSKSRRRPLIVLQKMKNFLEE